jgi:seryl-tRNA synthetase
MDITHYAFATYIFLLIMGGAWFLAKVLRSGKDRGGKSSYEKEQRLFTMYQNLEDMLAGFEELAEETRKSTEEALERSEQALRQASEIAEEVRRLSKKPETVEGPAQPEEPRGVLWSEQPKTPEPELVQEEPDQAPIWEAPAPRPVEKGEDSSQVGSPLKLNEKIRLLSAQGLMPVEIAKTLGISVREVTLAIEMGRK